MESAGRHFLSMHPLNFFRTDPIQLLKFSISVCLSETLYVYQWTSLCSRFRDVMASNRVVESLDNLSLIFRPSNLRMVCYRENPSSYAFEVHISRRLVHIG